MILPEGLCVSSAPLVTRYRAVTIVPRIVSTAIVPSATLEIKSGITTLRLFHSMTFNSSIACIYLIV